MDSTDDVREDGCLTKFRLQLDLVTSTWGFGSSHRLLITPLVLYEGKILPST